MTVRVIILIIEIFKTEKIISKAGGSKNRRLSNSLARSISRAGSVRVSRTIVIRHPGLGLHGCSSNK